jgi:hypothetical protein
LLLPLLLPKERGREIAAIRNRMLVRRLKTETTVRTATLVLRSRLAIPMSKGNQRLQRSLVTENNLIGPLYLTLCIYAECSGFGKRSISPAAANSLSEAMADGTRVGNQLRSAANDGRVSGMIERGPDASVEGFDFDRRHLLPFSNSQC